MPDLTDLLPDPSHTPVPLAPPPQGAEETARGTGLGQIILSCVLPVVGLSAVALLSRDALEQVFTMVPRGLRHAGLAVLAGAAMAWGARRPTRTAGVLALLVGLAAWTTAAVASADGASLVSGVTAMLMIMAAAGVLCHIADRTSQESWATLGVAAMFWAPWAATTRPDALLIPWLVHGVVASLAVIEMLRRRPQWTAARLATPLLLWASAVALLLRVSDVTAATSVPSGAAILVMSVLAGAGLLRLPLGARWAMPTFVLTALLTSVRAPWPVVPALAAGVALGVAGILLIAAVQSAPRVLQYTPRLGFGVVLLVAVALVAGLLNPAEGSLILPAVAVVAGLLALSDAILAQEGVQAALSAATRMLGRSTTARPARPTETDASVHGPLWVALLFLPVLAVLQWQRLLLAAGVRLEWGTALAPVDVVLFLLVPAGLLAGAWRVARAEHDAAQAGYGMPAWRLSVLWIAIAGVSVLPLGVQWVPDLWDLLARLVSLEAVVLLSALALLLAPRIDRAVHWLTNDAGVDAWSALVGSNRVAWQGGTFSQAHAGWRVLVLAQVLLTEGLLVRTHPLALTLWGAALAWRLVQDGGLPLAWIADRARPRVPLRRLVWRLSGLAALGAVLTTVMQAVAAGPSGLRHLPATTVVDMVVWTVVFATAVALARWYRQRVVVGLALVTLAVQVGAVLLSGTETVVGWQRVLAFGTAAVVCLVLAPAVRWIEAQPLPAEVDVARHREVVAPASV